MNNEDKCGTMCNPVSAVPESSTAVRAPSRAELKTLLITNLIQRMARAVLLGYNPTMAVTSDSHYVEIPWTEMPLLLRDDQGGLLASASCMFNVENIEEVVLVGMPELR